MGKVGINVGAKWYKCCGRVGIVWGELAYVGRVGKYGASWLGLVDINMGRVGLGRVGFGANRLAPLKHKKAGMVLSCPSK